MHASVTCISLLMLCWMGIRPCRGAADGRKACNKAQPKRQDRLRR